MNLDGTCVEWFKIKGNNLENNIKILSYKKRFWTIKNLLNIYNVLEFKELILTILKVYVKWPCIKQKYQKQQLIILLLQTNKIINLIIYYLTSI